jgi:hypothetical protein
MANSREEFAGIDSPDCEMPLICPPRIENLNSSHTRQ